MSSIALFNNVENHGELRNFHADLETGCKTVNQLIADRCGSPAILPDLVFPEFIREPGAYQQFFDLNKKEAFKRAMIDSLRNAWTDRHGAREADRVIANFQNVADALNENGALIMASVIETVKFQKLINSYNKILGESGSKSWIHTFVNLGNHPRFLTDGEFNEAFLHPLLLALISFRVGGPIRIVDARGKDNKPINVIAQDNILHIDNTPFRDEFKVILTWEKDRASGPKGQNFLFLSSTHKGYRNCFSDEEKGVWSTVNASNFISEAAIDRLLHFQKQVRQCDRPMLVEVTHEKKPLTTVFAAGSLVHHRYGTTDGQPRSSVIIAFNRAADNPGQFFESEDLQGIPDHDLLTHLIFGSPSKDASNDFLKAIAKESERIRSVLWNLENNEAVQEIIHPSALALTKDKIEQWKKNVIEAPTVEDLKIKAGVTLVQRNLSKKHFADFVQKMMSFDKHGSLDLILYSDGHEEIRKWARNQIREMNIDDMNKRMQSVWANYLQLPSERSLLSIKELEEIAGSLSQIALAQKASNSPISLRKGERISCEKAYDSITQLLLDTGETITRCESRQAFLSASLFLFLAADVLMRLRKPSDYTIQAIGKKLLNHYISMGIVINKQIEMDHIKRADSNEM